jgi:hypothetical protein
MSYGTVVVIFRPSESLAAKKIECDESIAVRLRNIIQEAGEVSQQ